jgi:signal transduction histidine kinase
LADEKNPVEVAAILNDLDRAVAALKGETTLDQSFAQQASETRETWAGVLDIEISVAASAKNLLENAITARCAAEILKELAGNAYRHGKAKSLVISFTQDGNGDLRLTASNDGTNLGGDTPGLGSDLFSDLTMSWSVSNDANGVNFEAVLPAITP